MKIALFRSIFTAAMTVFLLCFICFYSVLFLRLEHHTRKELQDEASYLAGAIAEHGTDFLADSPIDLTSLTILNRDGTILFTTGSEVLDEDGIASLLAAFESGKDTHKTELFTLHGMHSLPDDSVLIVTGTESVIEMLLIEMLLPFCLILLAAIFLSLYLASRVSDNITAPIVRFDPDSPDERGIYDELLPFVEKIRARNRQVREQIEQIEAAHEQQDAMRREFTANVSHELKTPLTVISGSAEILENGLVPKEDVPRFASGIRKEAARMIALIDDIIKLSRLDENAFPGERQPIALYPLCAEILARLEEHASRKQVSLSLEGDEAKVLGQPTVLHEMIYNLCDNAIKYNRPGGSVAVRIEQDEGRITVSVIDNGIGMPKEELERIFERFYRIDKSHSRQIGGTGLGLSIVKHGAKMHGAKIEVASDLGKGSTIKLIFPLA